MAADNCTAAAAAAAVDPRWIITTSVIIAVYVQSKWLEEGMGRGAELSRKCYGIADVKLEIRVNETLN